MVYVVTDVVTGAAYSDFQHYALEFQMGYEMPLSMQHKAFK